MILWTEFFIMILKALLKINDVYSRDTTIGKTGEKFRVPISCTESHWGRFLVMDSFELQESMELIKEETLGLIKVLLLFLLLFLSPRKNM